jgi:GNAT superfamily N-acetyltransferase
MTTGESNGSPSHAEPILAVPDVMNTVQYWHEVLGFPDKWTWGEPPNYGGVAWHGAFIQFSQNPALAAASRGNSIFIRVKKLEAMYAFHQKQHAEIIEPLENKPWGMAGYTVRELNGYYIVFAGAAISDKHQQSAALPSTIKIIPRKPSIKEYRQLASSVNWTLFLDEPVVEKLLQAPLFAVVAEDTTSQHVVGCALLLGDHASFYYVKDLIVDPGWQSKHVGTALMNALMDWLNANGAVNAFVTLITGETLASFYQQFGFAQAFGMVKHIQPKKVETI